MKEQIERQNDALMVLLEKLLIIILIQVQKAGGVCRCGRHKGEKIEVWEQHTVDVDVLQGNKIQKLYAVPCFVYSQGVIDKGFTKNDRVWIQFINGDPSMPIATAYYREPDQIELFWNNLSIRVAGFFEELLPVEGYYELETKANGSRSKSNRRY